MANKLWLGPLGLGVLAMGLGIFGLVTTGDEPQRQEAFEPMRPPDSIAPATPYGDEADDNLLPGVPLGDGVTVARGTAIGNLSVFPVYGARMHAVPAVYPLHTAIQDTLAVVREVGAQPMAAQVHQLEFDNQSDRPLLSLGGSMLGGGFQDRFITRDFIVEPNDKQAVHVHCAEHHRWDGVRNGKLTSGEFQVLPTFVGTYLHATAELTQNQVQVWDRVDEMNAAHCKSPATATLAATLEDPTLSARRMSLAKKVSAALASRPMAEHIVGMAYAVNGGVRNVRVFANHALYGQFIDHLSQTAAFDALSEPQKALTEGEQMVLEDGIAENDSQDEVVGFVQHIREQADESHAEEAGRTKTIYLRARRGYGAVTSWIAEEQREVPFTASYVVRPGDEGPAPQSACLL